MLLSNDIGHSFVGWDA